MNVEKQLMLEMFVNESLEMVVDESLEMIKDESFDMIMDESLMVEDKSLEKLMDETLKLDEEHFEFVIADCDCCCGLKSINVHRILQFYDLNRKKNRLLRDFTKSRRNRKAMINCCEIVVVVEELELLLTNNELKR
ncbi:hypothetical protein Tco_0865486 [Tanacetum coccineum]